MEATTSSSPSIRRDWPFVAAALIVIVLDQITKIWVATTLNLYESVPAEGFLRFTYVENTGSAFGLFQGGGMFLIMASLIGVLAITFYYRTLAEHPPFRWAMGILLGGAAGNLIDRVFRGAVVDFVDIELWPGFHFPAFNVADASINIGLFALLFLIFISRKDRIAEPIDDALADGEPMSESDREQ